eukprot:10672272-Lingulodinium_polyedra.AAC.1
MCIRDRSGPSLSPRSSRWGLATTCPSIKFSRPARSNMRRRLGLPGSLQKPGRLAVTWSGTRRSTTLVAYPA